MPTQLPQTLAVILLHIGDGKPSSAWALFSIGRSPLFSHWLQGHAHNSSSWAPLHFLFCLHSLLSWAMNEHILWGKEWVKSHFILGMNLYSALFFLFSLCNSIFFPSPLLSFSTFFCLYLSFLFLPSQLFITVIFFPSHWTLDVVLIDRRGLKAHWKAPVFLNRFLSHQKMYSNIPLEHIIWK